MRDMKQSVKYTNISEYYDKNISDINFFYDTNTKVP